MYALLHENYALQNKVTAYDEAWNYLTLLRKFKSSRGTRVDCYLFRVTLYQSLSVINLFFQQRKI